MAHAQHCPLNSRPLCLAALHWLERAKEQINPYHLHLLTLAQWGLENGAEGEWPHRSKHALEMQVGHLAGWTPVQVLNWMLENPNGPERAEQEQSLLTSLNRAKNPAHAAGLVLSEIWSRQKDQNPALA